MNSCPYYLVAAPTITKLADLKNKTVACREGPSRNTPIAETFRNLAQLDVGKNLTLQMPKGDQDAFNLLIDGKVDGAFLPRPFGFIAEERDLIASPSGRMWSMTHCPLPSKPARNSGGKAPTILESSWQRTGKVFAISRAIADDAIRILTKRFGHSESLANKTCKDYIVCMDESLQVDFKHFAKLLTQVAPEKAFDARQVASEWIATGAVNE